MILTKFQLALIATAISVFLVAMMLVTAVLFWEIRDHRVRNEQAHYVDHCLLLLPPAPARSPADVAACEREAARVYPPP